MQMKIVVLKHSGVVEGNNKDLYNRTAISI